MPHTTVAVSAYRSWSLASQWLVVDCCDCCSAAPIMPQLCWLSSVSHESDASRRLGHLLCHCCMHRHCCVQSLQSDCTHSMFAGHWWLGGAHRSCCTPFSRCGVPVCDGCLLQCCWRQAALAQCHHPCYGGGRIHNCITYVVLICQESGGLASVNQSVPGTQLPFGRDRLAAKASRTWCSL